MGFKLNGFLSDEDIHSQRRREKKKFKKLSKHPDKDLEYITRNEKRESMQKRNNLRIEKSKRSCTLGVNGDWSTPSPQDSKKITTSGALSSSSPVVSPSSSSSQLASLMMPSPLTVAVEDLADSSRLAHSPYYRALFNRKEDSGLLDGQELGINSSEESSSSEEDKPDEPSDPLQADLLSDISLWPAISPNPNPISPAGRRLAPLSTNLFARSPSQRQWRKLSLASPGHPTASPVRVSSPRGPGDPSRKEGLSEGREEHFVRAAIDRLYRVLFLPESEATPVRFRRWDDPDSESDEDSAPEPSGDLPWTRLAEYLPQRPVPRPQELWWLQHACVVGDPAVLRLAEGLLRDGPLTALHLRTLATGLPACDAPDRRFFASLVSAHWDPPPGPQMALLCPHSLSTAFLLRRLRPAVLYELVGQLDFEDERCPSVRAHILRRLLAAAREHSNEEMDIFNRMSRSVLTALEESAANRGRRCEQAASVAEECEVDANQIAKRGLPCLWVDSEASQELLLRGCSLTAVLAAPARLKTERPAFRARDSCLGGLQLAVFVAALHLHHHRHTLTLRGPGLGGLREVPLSLSRILLSVLRGSYGHKLGSASELSEQPDLLAALSELLQALLMLAVCADARLTIVEDTHSDGNHYHSDGIYYNSDGNHYDSDENHYNSDENHYNSDGKHYNSGGNHYHSDGNHYNSDGKHSDSVNHPYESVVRPSVANEVCEFLLCGLARAQRSASAARELVFIRLCETLLTFYQPLNPKALPLPSPSNNVQLPGIARRHRGQEAVASIVRALVRKTAALHFKVALGAVGLLQAPHLLLKLFFPRTFYASLAALYPHIEVGLWSGACADEVLQALVGALRLNREAFWHPAVSSASSTALDTILSYSYTDQDDDEDDDLT